MTADTWVYFIQAKTGGPVKIGWAVNVDERLATLQTGNPATLHVLGVCAGDVALEAEIHRRLAEHRIRGEWFHPVKQVFAVMLEVGALGRRDRDLERPFTTQAVACKQCDYWLGSINPDGYCSACAQERATT